MLLALALLILALLFLGFGFVVHVLWIVAVVVFLLWLIGFFVRGGSGSSRRWYRW